MGRNKYITGTPLERLYAYIEVQSNGCWHWTACINKTGYGSVKHNGKAVGAHRLSYELFKGPIPGGLVVDHTCHDPRTCICGNRCMHRRCVNPDHLELTTDEINCSKARSAGNHGDASAAHAATRARAALITHCPHGHEYTSENTLRYGVRRYCRECARLHSERGNRKRTEKRLQRLAAASVSGVQLVLENTCPALTEP